MRQVFGLVVAQTGTDTGGLHLSIGTLRTMADRINDPTSPVYLGNDHDPIHPPLGRFCNAVVATAAGELRADLLLYQRDNYRSMPAHVYRTNLPVDHTVDVSRTTLDIRSDGDWDLAALIPVHAIIPGHRETLVRKSLHEFDLVSLVLTTTTITAAMAFAAAFAGRLGSKLGRVVGRDLTAAYERIRTWAASALSTKNSAALVFRLRFARSGAGPGGGTTVVEAVLPAGTKPGCDEAMQRLPSLLGDPLLIVPEDARDAVVKASYRWSHQRRGWLPSFVVFDNDVVWTNFPVFPLSRPPVLPSGELALSIGGSLRPQDGRASASDYDVFVCHASEDKRDVVKPVVDACKKIGITCWYDSNELVWGDSLIQKVNQGLKRSQYVMVVLSKNSIDKKWPLRELAATLAAETEGNCTKVLPLLVGTPDEIRDIRDRLPLLRDKLALSWRGDPTDVVEALKKRLCREPRPPVPRSPPRVTPKR